MQSLRLYPHIETHNYAAHIQHNIHQPTCGLLFAKSCIHFNIPLIINNSATCILDKEYTYSLQDFSGYIKTHILQSYQENCILVACYVCNSQT